MQIHTVSYMKKNSQGIMSLNIESFYKQQDALEFYTLKKEELENNSFHIVKHFFGLDSEYLTFEEMSILKYIYYNEQKDIYSLIVNCRGESHYLNLTSHNLIKFN